MNFFFKYQNYYILAILLIIFHFIPFERSSLAPDDYSLINNDVIGFFNFIKYPDRPILYLWLELQYQILGLNLKSLFLLLVISNYLLILCTFHLFKQFFENNDSLILTIINLLIYFKLEIFHNSIMIHICIVTSIYLLSLIFLIKYLKKRKNVFLLLSIFLYTVSIYWYEIGFFLPLIFIFYDPKFKLNVKEIIKNLKIISPFLIIMIIYSILRITNIFGIALTESSYSINLNILTALNEYFNHIFGRYALKNILYGLYQFLHIDMKYLVFIFFLNIFIIIQIYKKLILIKKIKHYHLFFLLFLILSSIPIILNASAGGRNLILISISITYFIYIFFERIQKKFILIVFFLLIIVNQGNAWSQYIASKIQYSILNTIEINKNKISSYENLVINMKSFADNIPHSFFKNDYNILNTYYGFQVWELWGFYGFLNKNKISTNLIITDEDPIYINSKVNLSQLKVIKNYNKISNNISINAKELFLIDYSKIDPPIHLNVQNEQFEK